MRRKKKKKSDHVGGVNIKIGEVVLVKPLCQQ